MGICYWTVTSTDGYGVDYITACGHRTRMVAPIEVGMCFTPKPTDGGVRYCKWCGGKLKHD